MPLDKRLTFPMPTGPNGDLDDPSVIRVGRFFRVNWAFVNENPSCYVYEVYDVQNRLVYVGVTDEFAGRWTAHRRSSWWARSIQIYCVILTGYRSRFEARVIEALLIAEHRPPCNVKPERKYLSIALGMERPNDILTAELEPTGRI